MPSAPSPSATSAPQRALSPTTVATPQRAAPARAAPVPAATVDAVRAHPLVRQAMEIFDATSIRVRAKAPTPADAALHETPDEGEPAMLIDAPQAPEGDR